MLTHNFNLRNLQPETMLLLRKEAELQSISMNSLILDMINKGLGVVLPSKKKLFHDLDYLAGTWSEEEWKSFNNSTKSFEQIDEGMW